MVRSMRLLLSLTISLTLTATASFATEPGLIINLSSMTTEYNKGQYQTAFYIGSQFLKQEPSNLGVHYLLGNCYVKFGQMEKAREEYAYCARAGQGSTLGAAAQQALQQVCTLLSKPQTPLEKAGTSAGAAGTTPATTACTSAAGAGTAAATPSSTGTTGAAAGTAPASAPGSATASGAAAVPAPVDKVDLQTLEYKERILKQGADLIAANRTKLKNQIESLRREAAQNMQSDFAMGSGSSFVSPEMRIKQLEDDNAAEELKITAFYKGQADAIGRQKGDLTSQAQPGNGDVRLRQQGSGLFLRNYVNYHGQVPLPPPPPELQAKAMPLNMAIPAKKSVVKNQPKDGSN